MKTWYLLFIGRNKLAIGMQYRIEHRVDASSEEQAKALTRGSFEVWAFLVVREIDPSDLKALEGAK